MRLYALYFSPTGGTKKVIDVISSAWDCEKTYIDLTEQTALQQIVFEKDDVCLVAVPSFSGRVPQFVLPKLRQMKGTGIQAILITAYGNRAFDDTLIELKNTLTAAGFCCVSAVAAVTQHSLMPKYGARRPDSMDIAELEQFAKQCKSATETIANEIAVPGNTPHRPYLTVPFTPKANQKCTGCGLCATKCPVQAILPQNLRASDKTICISCMQCVNICPQQARHINGLLQKLGEIKMRKLCSGRKENQFYGQSV